MYLKAHVARRRPVPSRQRRPDFAGTAMATRQAIRCASTCAPKTGTSKAISPACRIACADASPTSTISARFALPSCAAMRSGQPMMISYSLNQMHDLGVREGVEVDIALRVDRVRVFPDNAAQARRARARNEFDRVAGARVQALRHGRRWPARRLAARGGILLLAARAVRVSDRAAGDAVCAQRRRSRGRISSAWPTSFSTCSRRRWRTRPGTR